MSSAENGNQGDQAQLGLWDATSIIVGIIIGAGIYETPPGIFRMMPDPWTALGVWAACGLLVLIGALCYAELATAYPRSGGDYVYLTRAYGPLIGYLFGWAQLAVIQTGSIGLMAYIFADYGARLFEIEKQYAVFLAAGAVIVMTLLNMVGVKLGALAQNLLTAVKILGLIGIVVAGFAYAKVDYDVFAGTVVGIDGKSVGVKNSSGEERTFALSEKTKFLLDHSDKRKNKETKKDEPVTANDFKVDDHVKVVTQRDAAAATLQLRSASTSLDLSSLAFAMVLVLLTYGGWNDAAFVAAEVRNQQRNIPRALVFGTFGVMIIYLTVNYAYINGLGFEAAQDSREIAADVLKLLPWEYGEQAMSILVMISALGAVNGLIFTSSRIYSTLGADYSLFALLSRKDGKAGPPVNSLILQLVIALLMIAAVGTKFGQEMLNEGLDLLGQSPVSWEGQSGFNSLLRCTAPIFWIFFLMTGLALFVLRMNDRDLKRPFSVPLFPILPLIFCAMCGYMVHSGVGYAGGLGYVGAVLVLAGLPFYIFSRRTERSNSGDDRI
jgi:basic amino acid/polyamine antiporter, APA family